MAAMFDFTLGVASQVSKVSKQALNSVQAVCSETLFVGTQS